MNLSPTLQEFWTLLGSYLLAMVIVGFVGGIGFGLAPVALALGVMLLGLGLGLLGYKKMLARRWPTQWSVQTVDVAGWPSGFGTRPDGQDFELLAQYTQSLTLLGFVVLQDYAPAQSSRQSSGSATSNLNIARCFAHPTQHCFAEVGQSQRADGSLQISHAVFFSLLDQGWMRVDLNRGPQTRDSLTYTWRHPREVRCYHPGIPLDAVFEQHLAARGQMLDSLNVGVRPDQSWEIYREIQQELILRPRQQLRQRNLLLAMIEATQFEQAPQLEWLGEYRQVLQARPLQREASLR
jgi:hypothetical protein